MNNWRKALRRNDRKFKFYFSGKEIWGMDIDRNLSNLVKVLSQDSSVTREKYESFGRFEPSPAKD